VRNPARPWAIRALGRRHEAQPRRRHQALLGAGDRHIDAPAVHREWHGGERRDGVHHQQCAVAGGVDRPADRRDVVDRARGGIDLDHQDGLDRALGVTPQPLLQGRGIDRMAPAAAQDLGLDPQHRRHLAPGGGESATFQHQDAIAPREHVDQRRLPGTVAIGGVDVDLPRGAEHPAEIG
jgi:hypothetical protein